MVGETVCDWLDVCAAFETLRNDACSRVRSYRAFVNDLVGAEKEAPFIGAAVDRNQWTGGSKFIAEVEQRIGVRVEYRAQGRRRATLRPITP